MTGTFAGKSYRVAGRVVMGMDDVRDEGHLIELGDDIASRGNDLVTHHPRPMGVDADRVAAGSQATFEVAHHDLCTGAMIELIIRDQDLQATNLTTADAEST